MSPTHKTRPVNEKLTPETWRWLQMCKAGIAERVATVLSESKADLHQILRAKEAGCKDRLLLRIFADETPKRIVKDGL